MANVRLAENQPASLTPFCPPPGCTGEGNGVGDTAGDAVGGEVIFYGAIGLVMTTASSKGGDAGRVSSSDLVRILCSTGTIAGQDQVKSMG